MKRGLFITMEGGEGVGKSTNLLVIQRWLETRGVTFVATREPGGTARAESIRELLLTPQDEPLDATAELLLVFAARAQHLSQRILPALARGEWVLCDRFTDATFAYQGGGRQLAKSRIEALEQLVQGDLRPDYTFLLDAPVEVGMSRARGRGNLDRFEQEDLAFFSRVREAYHERASAEPDRFKIIPCDRSLEEIASDLESTLATIHGEWCAE